MKKYLLGLFAIALAVGFSAFTSQSPPKVKTTNSQFIFVGTNGNYFANIPSDWVDYTGSNDCSSGSNLCRVVDLTGTITTTTQLAQKLYDEQHIGPSYSVDAETFTKP